ncbi:MAG: proteasome subunit beta, partial [Actinomycetota bacterium]|nr:proteasome subunit beta [Actinomycetota bacterium]
MNFRPARPPASPPSAGISTALPAPYFTPGSASFTDFIADAAPHLLLGGVLGADPAGRVSAMPLDIPHGTTVVALTCAGGVVIAGDRRATSGNIIAQRDIEKVFVTDSYSAVGIAGAAGVAVEMVRLFTVDLEHYEKIEGVPLSLEGKANKLAGMVRANLGAALQGFVVVPLFAGYDT